MTRNAEQQNGSSCMPRTAQMMNTQTATHIPGLCTLTGNMPECKNKPHITGIPAGESS